MGLCPVVASLASTDLAAAPLAGGGILFVIPPDAAFIPAAGESAATTPSPDGPGQWVPLLALWAGGAAAFIIWQLVSYRNFLAALGSGMRPAALPSFGGIPVIESEAAVGPLAVGILDRRIVVPPLFEYRYTPVEQELALSHELVHHRRGDLLWNSAGLVVLALNWFNPIAYFAFRAFRADQELACDAAHRAPLARPTGTIMQAHSSNPRADLARLQRVPTQFGRSTETETEDDEDASYEQDPQPEWGRHSGRFAGDRPRLQRSRLRSGAGAERTRPLSRKISRK